MRAGTNAALRATEIGADLIIKGTKVDGVYDSDPVLNPDAVRFDTISYTDIIEKELKVMDATAITLCKENNIPIIVCKLLEHDNLRRIVTGEKIGTIVKGVVNG